MEVCLQTSIFAPLFNRKHISLDYGVMVAQQVLVLFVQVRILVVQRRKALKEISFGAFSFFVDAKSLLKSLERSHTEQQHDDFYSLVAKTGLSLKPWGIALKFLFLHHENILFPND